MLRRAAVAGSWYPGTPRALEQALDACLAEVAPHSLSGPLLGLVAPHAGLTYSGGVAAHAYALLKGQRDRTVILAGPSHRLAFEGVAVFAEGEFETPLGRIPVDGAAARALLSEPLVVDWPAPHVGEHSLEMQLPFLQRRALNQAARELLLAQSSDWASIMKTGTTVEDAQQRTRDHLARFTWLHRTLLEGGLDQAILREFEERDNLFPDLDYRVYA